MSDNAVWLLVGPGGHVGGQKATGMGGLGQRILVIGQSTPLMEGVSDLLQVVGYPVDVSTTWTEAEYAMHHTPPDLVIVDLSFATSDPYQLAEQIRTVPHGSEVPILFISFSGDDHIRELQWLSQRNGDRRLYFYAHTLLGMDGLLEKVRVCLS